MSWHEVVQMILDYRKVQVIGSKGHHYSSRVKQWLGQMRQSYPEANELFADIKKIRSSDDMVDALNKLVK
jgi:tRNA-dihydrouridine synthase C